MSDQNLNALEIRLNELDRKIEELKKERDRLMENVKTINEEKIQFFALEKSKTINQREAK